MSTWYVGGLFGAAPGVYVSTNDLVSVSILNAGGTNPTNGTLQCPAGGFYMRSTDSSFFNRADNNTLYITTSSFSNQGVVWTQIQNSGSDNANDQISWWDDDFLVTVAQAVPLFYIFVSPAPYTSATQLTHHANVYGITRASNGTFYGIANNNVAGTGVAGVHIFKIDPIGLTLTDVADFSATYDGFGAGGSSTGNQIARSTSGTSGVIFQAHRISTGHFQIVDLSGAVLLDWTDSEGFANNQMINGAFSITAPTRFEEFGTQVYCYTDGGSQLQHACFFNGVSWSHLGTVGPSNIPGVSSFKPFISQAWDTGTFLCVHGTGMRSTNGSTWTTTTGFNATYMTNLASPVTALQAATPANFFQPDRNIPLAIAGPRADQVLAQYQPFARVFTH